MAMVIFCTSLSIGASALRFDYSQPAGYDSIEKPYISFEQSGTMLLDFVDNMLADANIKDTVDLSILGSISYNFTSVDNLVSSILGIYDSSLFNTANALVNLGDLENLNVSGLRNTPKRNHQTIPDINIIAALCVFLKDNKTILGKAIDGNLSLGTIAGWFVDINGLLGDIQQQIKDALYNVLVDPATSTLTNKSSLDDMIDEMIYGMLMGPDGFIPSLEDILVSEHKMSAPGKKNFHVANLSLYDTIRFVIRAAMKDFVAPMLIPLFKGLDQSILDLIAGLLGPGVDISAMTTEEFVYALLDLEHGLLTNYIQIDDDGLKKKPGFNDLISGLLGIVKGLLPTLSLYPNIETRDVNAIVDEEELVAYLVRTILVGMMDFAVIPANVTSLREVLTYLLINLMSDWYPDKDFDALIANGTINPKTDGALQIAAEFLYYYFNAVLDVAIPPNLNFDDTLAWVFNEYLIKSFGGLLRTANFSVDHDVWKDIDILLWNNILNINWLHADFGALPVGLRTKTILFDKLIYAILDWDFDALFSLFRVNPTGELSLGLNTIILNLVKRVLNGVFEGNTIVPNALASFNPLLTKTTNPSMFRQLLENLLTYLPVVDPDPKALGETFITRILKSALPLLAQSLAGVDGSAWRPQPGPNLVYSVVDLEVMLRNQVPDYDNSTLSYTDPAFFFFGQEDFVLYQYYNYNDMRTEAQGILERAKAGDPNLSAQDITDAAYRLQYYYNKMQPRLPSTMQLIKETQSARDLYGYGEYDIAEGSRGLASQFTLRTWYAYSAAMNFAYQVIEERFSDQLNGTSVVRQSKITFARRLLIEAQKLLKGFTGAADFSRLDMALRAADAKFMDDELALPYGGAFLTESLQILRNAYQHGLIVRNGGYDGSEQNIIDDAEIAILEAIENLEAIPDIVTVIGSSTVIDRNTGYVWGFSEGYTGFSSYVKVRDGAMGYIEVVNNVKGKIGTGAKLNLKLDDETVRSYTVLVYGDVDGNTRADGMDANVVFSHIGGLFPIDYYLGAAFMIAADANYDGAVDWSDYNMLIDAGLKKVKVNQHGAQNN